VAQNDSCSLTLIYLGIGSKHRLEQVDEGTASRRADPCDRLRIVHEHLIRSGVLPLLIDRGGGNQDRLARRDPGHDGEQVGLVILHLNRFMKPASLAPKSIVTKSGS